MMKRGFTLIEVLISIAMLAIATSGLFLFLTGTPARAAHLGQVQIALAKAQGTLEELITIGFDELTTNVTLANARSPSGQCEDSTGPGGESDGVCDIIPGLPEGIVWFHVRPGTVGPVARPSSFLDLTVSVCWRAQGRVIGEDRNCNGQLDAGEDANGNGWLDSPAMVSTRLAENQ